MTVSATEGFSAANKISERMTSIMALLDSALGCALREFQAESYYNYSRDKGIIEVGYAGPEEATGARTMVITADSKSGLVVIQFNKRDIPLVVDITSGGTGKLVAGIIDRINEAEPFIGEYMKQPNTASIVRYHLRLDTING